MRTITTRRAVLGLAALSIAGTLPVPALAQAFPSRAITLVVPFPAGGGPDLAARVLGEKLAAQMGQPVVVENKPGAGALLGATAVARSAPDGYTLLLTPNTLVISPHVLPAGATANIDVRNDLVPIIAPAVTPLILVTSPKLGVKDLKSALALARKSGKLTYGSPGSGSPMHFAGEMLKHSAGVDLLHVPYRGVAPSITAALAGEIDILITGLGGALQYIKAGKLVPLALIEKSRSQLLPDVPTATEQGVPNVEVNAWYGLFAPKGTPPAVINKLNEEVNKALKLPDVQEKLLKAGIEPLGGTPERLAEFVSSDDQRYGQLAKELAIKVQ